MTGHQLARKLLELPEIEMKCLGNTEEFGVEDVGDWNGEFVYASIHPVEKRGYV